MVVVVDVKNIKNEWVAAHNDARSKLQSKLTEQMSGVLPLGMKMPF